MTDKLLVEIKSTSAQTKAPHGSFEAVLSVPTVDRDKQIVDAGAFDPLPEHITIDIDHAMSVEKTVGSGRPFYDGGILKFEGTYASHPLAQMVRSLVDEGHIRTMSVAYMNSHYEIDEKDGLAHLRRGELLNAGIVGIPSNRQALITASKSLVRDVLGEDDIVIGYRPEAAKATVSEYVARFRADPRVWTVDEARAIEEKSGARHSAADMQALQTAHDALAALGAACEQKSAPTGDENPTDTDAKAATAAAEQAPAVPAPVTVNVAKAKALRARAAMALLDN